AALVQKVQNCLKEEAWIKNPSVEVFLAALRRRLDACVDGKLANAVTNIHVKREDKSRNLDREFYEKKLPELCKNLQRMTMPVFNQMLPDLIKAVMQEMSSVPDENCRPRCEARCPACGSICYHAKGHSAAKHNTIHQPAGLAGHKWFRKIALVERSCLQCLETAVRMVREDGARVIPFSEFDKEYPEWDMPTSNEASAIQMREWIFFRYQRELVDYFNARRAGQKFGPAENMPTAYNHDRAQLQARLHNTLRPKFPNEDAWTQFIQLLKTF
ncbi:hypothetical protein GOP47_0007938, partial [Adiantum capillus-veneris]